MISSYIEANHKLFSPTALTIAGGAITITQGHHTVSAESGTSDDLDTINGGGSGLLLMLTAATGHTVTLKHGTGNIQLSSEGDYLLTEDRSLLLYDRGDVWVDAAGVGGLSTTLGGRTVSTDAPNDGDFLGWDSVNSNWEPTTPRWVRLFAVDHTQVDLTNVGGTVISFTIPGGTLGTNKSLHIRFPIQTTNGHATSGRPLYMTVTLGATTVFNGVTTVSVPAASNVRVEAELYLHNVDAANSQAWYLHVFGNYLGWAMSAEDTANDLTLTVALTSLSNNLTSSMRGYEVFGPIDEVSP